MSDQQLITIDQNCNSLWDVVPKLDALAARGLAASHYIEDVDVAFTSVGSSVLGAALHVEQERFYRSGGADWGAALFYTQFLGRQPVDLRRYEPYLGMHIHVLAHHLGRPMDDLYDEFSPGDNWQLIGPSYVGDQLHHRTMGDLAMDEVRDYLQQVLGLARHDMLERFGQEAARRRTSEWFDQEQARIAPMMEQSRTLTDFYRRWLGSYIAPTQRLDDTSSLFGRPLGGPGMELLNLFVRDYDTAAALYNQAVHEAGIGLRMLDIAAGELPIFAVMRYQGHLTRSAAFLRGRQLFLCDRGYKLPDSRLPVEELQAAGVSAMAGKAILLVLQVRFGPDGRPLVLPYHGSIYMPAAYRLQRLLQEHGLLAGDIKPVKRVRFCLLDRLADIDTHIHLPQYMAGYFGKDDIPASDLARNWRELAQQAVQRLERFKDGDFRRQWQEQAMPQLAAEIAQLDHRRRQLAAVNSKDPELRAIWKRIKPLQLRQTEELLRQVDRDWQMSQIDYYDSRGALLPWCVALGGREFYDSVIRQAQLYEEQP